MDGLNALKTSMKRTQFINSTKEVSKVTELEIATSCGWINSRSQSCSIYYFHCCSVKRPFVSVSSGRCLVSISVESPSVRSIFPEDDVRSYLQKLGQRLGGRWRGHFIVSKTSFSVTRVPKAIARSLAESFFQFSEQVLRTNENTASLG